MEEIKNVSDLKKLVFWNINQLRNQYRISPLFYDDLFDQKNLQEKINEFEVEKNIIEIHQQLISLAKINQFIEELIRINIQSLLSNNVNSLTIFAEEIYAQGNLVLDIRLFLFENIIYLKEISYCQNKLEIAGIVLKENFQLEKIQINLIQNQAKKTSDYLQGNKLIFSGQCFNYQMNNLFYQSDFEINFFIKEIKQNTKRVFDDIFLTKSKEVMQITIQSNNIKFFNSSFNQRNQNLLIKNLYQEKVNKSKRASLSAPKTLISQKQKENLEFKQNKNQNNKQEETTLSINQETEESVFYSGFFLLSQIEISDEEFQSLMSDLRNFQQQSKEEILSNTFKAINKQQSDSQEKPIKNYPEELSDLVIQAQEGQALKGHKLALISFADFWNVIFTQGGRKEITKVFDFNNYSKEEIGNFIHGRNHISFKINKIILPNYINHQSAQLLLKVYYDQVQGQSCQNISSIFTLMQFSLLIQDSQLFTRLIWLLICNLKMLNNKDNQQEKILKMLFEMNQDFVQESQQKYLVFLIYFIFLLMIETKQIWNVINILSSCKNELFYLDFLLLVNLRDQKEEFNKHIFQHLRNSKQIECNQIYKKNLKIFNQLFLIKQSNQIIAQEINQQENIHQKYFTPKRPSLNNIQAFQISSNNPNAINSIATNKENIKVKNNQKQSQVQIEDLQQIVYQVSFLQPSLDKQIQQSFLNECNLFIQYKSDYQETIFQSEEIAVDQTQFFITVFFNQLNEILFVFQSSETQKQIQATPFEVLIKIKEKNNKTKFYESIVLQSVNNYFQCFKIQTEENSQSQNHQTIQIEIVFWQNILLKSCLYYYQNNLEKIQFEKQEKCQPNSLQEFEQKILNENKLQQDEYLQLPFNMFLTLLVFSVDKNNQTTQNKFLILILHYLQKNQRKIPDRETSMILETINLEKINKEILYEIILYQRQLFDSEFIQKILLKIITQQNKEKINEKSQQIEQGFFQWLWKQNLHKNCSDLLHKEHESARQIKEKAIAIEKRLMKSESRIKELESNKEKFLQQNLQQEKQAKKNHCQIV